MYRNKTNNLNISHEADEKVENLFQKKSYLVCDGALPKNIFRTSITINNDLHLMKVKLNAVKSQLSDLNLEKWSKFTRSGDLAGNIRFKLREYEIEVLTQAFCKFYEMLYSCNILLDILPSLNKTLYTLHLGEAPGAFISALNHYLAKNHPEIKWEWTGNSLNPHHEGLSLSELIPDDQLIRYTSEKWNFCFDNTGDITKYHNYLSLVKDMEQKEIKLITADAGIDCMIKPEEQESLVYFLHYCESITALSLLAKGGNFVIKMFTFFEQPSISLLYLLNCSFEKIVICKPCTSKHGNSEVYVLCYFYKGKEFLNHLWPSLLEAYKNPQNFNNLAMFSWEEMGKSFLDMIMRHSEYFMNMQIKTINDNYRMFNNNIRFGKKTYQLKNLVVEHFLRHCPIDRLEENRKLIKKYFFEEIPQHQRYCFNNRHKFQSNWYFFSNSVILSNLNIEGDILDIKFGKAVTKIVQSPFYSFESFSEFCFDKFRRKTNGKLIDLCKKQLSINSVTIISMSDFPITEDNTVFQKYLFDLIYTKLGVTESVAFVSVPFVTNYAVSLLFILSLAFNYVKFLKGGVILFIESTESGFEKAKQCLNDVKKALNSLDNYQNLTFIMDINQIISPLVLEKNNFYKYIWNYNNSLCNLYFL